MVKFLSTTKDGLVRFLGGLGEIVDAIASIPSDELKNFVVLAGGVAVGFGLLSATSAPALEVQVFGVLTILITAAVAIKHVLTSNKS